MNRHWRFPALCGVTALFLAAAAGRSDEKKPPVETPVVVPSGPSARGTPADRTTYYAVMLGGKKIGQAITTFKAADKQAVTEVALQIRLGRGEMTVALDLTTRSVETLDGKPLGFTFTMAQGRLGQTVRGRVDKAGKLHTTYGQGPSQRTGVTGWPADALMEYGMKLVMEEKGFKEGTTYTVRAFDPSSLSAHDMTVTVGARKKTDLLGRSVMLTEVNGTLDGGVGTMALRTYVDDGGNDLKTVMSMMGMQLELIACGKNVAFGGNEVLDVLDRMMLASPTPLKGLAPAASVSYVMAPTNSGAKLKFLATDNQRIEAMPSGRVRVTVAPVAAPKNAPLPYTGADPQAAAALKPSQFVQSDDKKIRALARKAVGDAKDAATAARRIETFVRTYISKKNLSVGYATAAEVAETREGDCSEHAVLTAAMCRAAGIPARVVTGIAYVSRLRERRDVFAPHAWNEAYVGGQVDRPGRGPGPLRRRPRRAGPRRRKLRRPVRPGQHAGQLHHRAD